MSIGLKPSEYSLLELSFGGQRRNCDLPSVCDHKLKLKLVSPLRDQSWPEVLRVTPKLGGLSQFLDAVKFFLFFLFFSSLTDCIQFGIYFVIPRQRSVLAVRKEI